MGGRVFIDRYCRVQAKERGEGSAGVAFKKEEALVCDNFEFCT